MNKKFIEFVETNTVWNYNYDRKVFVLYRHSAKISFEAQPADLLGWWLQFMEENKHDPIPDMVGIIMDWARFGNPKEMTAQKAIEYARDKFLARLKEDK